MRGRVMALNAIAFLGSTPIGAPLLGYLSDVTNPRVALALGGAATLLASIPLFALAARQQKLGQPLPVADEVVTAVAEAEAANVVPLPTVADPLPLIGERLRSTGGGTG
jgi:hypothetical protein